MKMDLVDIFYFMYLEEVIKVYQDLEEYKLVYYNELKGVVSEYLLLEYIGFDVFDKFYYIEYFGLYFNLCS